MDAVSPVGDVAVVGLGPMGAPVARNLARAGLEVQVWNRTAAVAEALREHGALPVPSVDGLRARVVLSVLPDVPQLLALLSDRTLRAWGAGGSVLVVMSTTSPEQVRALEEHCRPFGVAVADAPMSGGDRGAREGALSIMVGAHDDAWRALQPVLEVIGGEVLRVGAPGAGSVAKLCNQIVVAGTLAVLAEALAVATCSGLDPTDLVTLLSGGLAGSAVLDLKRAKLLQREYSLGGSTQNQVKDLDYARAAAAAAGVTTPLLDVLAGLYRRTAETHAADDHSAVLEAYLDGRLSRPGGAASAPGA